MKTSGQVAHPTKQKRVKGVEFATTARKKLFLDVYAKQGTILAACQEARVARSTVSVWIEKDPDFRQGMITAKLATVDMLKKTAIDRAQAGSDPLLIFLLKNLAPDEFSERIRHEFTTKTLDLAVNEFIEVIRMNVPECCPHCKTNLGIAPAIAQELLDMSDRLSNKKTEVAQ